VVMNLADEHLFTRPRSHRAPDGEFRLIYHGTLTYPCGLDLGMRAVALLKEEIPEIRLTILGMGHQMPELARLRRELGLEGFVELHEGFPPRGGPSSGHRACRPGRDGNEPTSR
jgi:glycosyltransferase involved in cell wall biosynthesis